MITIAANAKQEIADFLHSKEAGVKSQFKRNTLIKAAESMFTEKGLRCPVIVTERGGETYLINRDIVNPTLEVNAPRWTPQPAA